MCACVCGQALQLKVRQQLALLQEVSEDQICSHLFSQTQMLIQTCEDLGSQVGTSVARSALIFCQSGLHVLVRTAAMRFKVLMLNSTRTDPEGRC